MRSITISHIPAISAIYYALLQTGYDFYSMERTQEHTRQIQNFYIPGHAIDFFRRTKQDTCSVYPYWPRAALLETATFYLNLSDAKYVDFPAYYEKVMSAGNLSAEERNQNFWDWIKDFPSALKTVVLSDSFSEYMKWEGQWIEKQNAMHTRDLAFLQTCLDVCRALYASTVENIQVVLSPIKCVYSSDYHMVENTFISTSGAFRSESVVHELLHSVVHPVVTQYQNNILECRQKYPELDESYYLSGHDEGFLNAFEEFVVRALVKELLSNTPPYDLTTYVLEMLAEK